MSQTFPATDTYAEASHITVQPAPGAIFIRLRREHDGEVFRRMFVEMTPGEALSVVSNLTDAINVALAAV